ncbi:hypothetical protein DN540_33270, partial [Burkholderia multivorans]
MRSPLNRAPALWSRSSASSPICGRGRWLSKIARHGKRPTVMAAGHHGTGSFRRRQAMVRLRSRR